MDNESFYDTIAVDGQIKASAIIVAPRGLTITIRGVMDV